MVTDRITDGYRIAELLAGELEGRTDGDLGRIAVTNADRSAEPTVGGSRAYDLTRDETLFARVIIYKSGLTLEFTDEAADVTEIAAAYRLEAAGQTITLKDGAAVKRAATAVDAVSQRGQ